MGEWKEYKLSELGLVVTGKTPSSKFPDEFGSDMPFVTPSDYGNYNKWALSAERFLSNKGIDKLNSKILPTGSLLVTCIGSDMGKVVMNKIPVITNQQINSIIPFDKFDSNFIYYKLLDEYDTLRMYGEAGTAVPIVNKTDFESIEVEIPKDKNEQQSIASILSSLDDKIDLLHRQNKTLEALAETLFRQWFVEEADESWEEVKLKSLCQVITKGTTPTTLGKQFVSNGINFLKVESLTEDGDFIESKFAFIDLETDKLLSRSRIQCNDVLITIAGTIGRVAIVTSRILPANTNQAIAIIRANKEIINPVFIYLLLKSPIVINDFESRVVHAVQPNLSLGEIGDISFRLPPKELLKNYSVEINDLIDKKEKNNIQIRTLTQLRDTLLPKLMSGAVRVKE